MKILLLEDDDALRLGLCANLRSEGWEVVEAGSLDAASRHVGGADLLVSDLRLPDGDGVEFMKRAKEMNPAIEAIIMTAFGSIPSAIEAMKRGARAYLAKPFDPDELVLHVKEAERTLKLRTAASRAGRGNLVGVSAAMRRVYAEIDSAAAAASPVLITGPTGTGKEEAAAAIHAASPRACGPFIAVNLGALPRELVESELFGHERGAFTGAHARKKGRFELAAGGTLFLDEVDSLPIELQPKLLRALEAGEIWPLGAEKAIKSTARILAATNSDLEDQIAKGKFRKDLFFRLNVLGVAMPALKDRPEDVPVIARAVLDRLEKKLGIARPCEIAPEVLTSLMMREWSGNVRELANILERGAARMLAERGNDAAGAARIERAHIEPGEGAASVERLPFAKAKAKAVEEWTKSVIKSALAETGGNVSEAARRLRIGRTSLLRLIAKHKIRG